MNENYVYIPYFEEDNCAFVKDKDTIRVYKSIPTINSTVPFTDYFVNSHYLSSKGETHFSNYVTVPSCIDNITTDWWHRVDVSDILLAILILCIFICIPFKVLFRLFRRFN